MKSGLYLNNKINNLLDKNNEELRENEINLKTLTLPNLLVPFKEEKNAPVSILQLNEIFEQFNNSSALNIRENDSNSVIEDGSMDFGVTLLNEDISVGMNKEYTFTTTIENKNYSLGGYGEIDISATAIQYTGTFKLDVIDANSNEVIISEYCNIKGRDKSHSFKFYYDKPYPNLKITIYTKKGNYTFDRILHSVFFYNRRFKRDESIPLIGLVEEEN